MLNKLVKNIKQHVPLENSKLKCNIPIKMTKI